MGKNFVFRCLNFFSCLFFTQIQISRLVSGMGRVIYHFKAPCSHDALSASVTIKVSEEIENIVPKNKIFVI